MEGCSRIVGPGRDDRWSGGSWHRGRSWGTRMVEMVGDPPSVTQGSTPVSEVSASCLKPFTMSLSPRFLLEDRAPNQAHLAAKAPYRAPNRAHLPSKVALYSNTTALFVYCSSRQTIFAWDKASCKAISRVSIVVRYQAASPLPHGVLQTGLPVEHICL